MSIARMVRVALASRRLFRNWLWAGVKYYLHRLGLLHADQVDVVCRDGSRDAMPMEVYGGLINGYFDGIVTDYSCRGRVVRFSGGFELPINGLSRDIRATLSAVRLGWSYDVEHGHWFKGNVKFRRMRGQILEVFEFGEYGGVDVVGRVVVDVGAYVGDSAIYFALRGAERVIAVEPHPGAFGEMLENIRLNNLEGKVIPINAGLASRHGRICLENADTESTGGKYHRLGDCISNIEAITLGEVLSRYVGSDDKPLLLKMDCEGCEYDVILNDYESVRRFDELVIEYHAYAVKRPVTELLNTLGRDFRCEVVSDEGYYRRHGMAKHELGMIRCVRHTQRLLT